jgi:hypothetical protein
MMKTASGANNKINAGVVHKFRLVQKEGANWGTEYRGEAEGMGGFGGTKNLTYQAGGIRLYSHFCCPAWSEGRGAVKQNGRTGLSGEKGAESVG